MKSYKTKIFSVLCAAMALGATSCVGDLDLMPNDPNTITAGNLTPEQYEAVLAKCYSGMAVSGQYGPDGASDISGLDGGTSQYTRGIFMLNEFTTDESKWIWADEGVFDLVTNTWSKGNANIFGTYSRMYVHIAICNDFLRLVGDNEQFAEMALEARTLRAMSYYNIIDLFGMGGFVTEADAPGTAPEQKSRKELSAWLEGELQDIVAKMSDAAPKYGRVGKDGAEALLARLYLNYEVFTGTPAYDKCAQCCENIIARHKGSGFQGSGLVENYLWVFCGDNDVYMPGGGDTNEILWGIAYDATNTQPYGGTTFLCAAAYKSVDEGGVYMNCEDYGLNQQWGCMHATPEFSDKFAAAPEDVRWSMWVKEDKGFKKENFPFSEFTAGYAVVKFTNLLRDNKATGSMKVGEITKYPNTDLPLIRLADVYLMYAECALRGAADTAKGLQYINYVRERAGVPAYTAIDLTLDNILDERCRELYWENVRRTDLVRFGKFAKGYNWSWKAGEDKGADFPEYMNVFPIPSNVIASQPDFKQNIGY